VGSCSGEHGIWRRARTMLAEDLRIARRDLVLNRIGASSFLPRPARLLVYRAAGVRTRSALSAGCTIAGDPRNISIGLDTFAARGCYFESLAPISVGNGTSLGMEVLVATSHHPLDGGGGWAKRAVGLPVTIGDRVWIGARAVVCPGARIESDVVVAAGAVVVGRLASGGLYAGVPARRIRDLARTPAAAHDRGSPA
jgi:maltose O-acetyltransferase